MSGEYTPEVLADLSAMVARGLPNWRLSAQTDICLLNVSENATFALTDPATRRNLILRVHRVGYSSADEIRSELAWINALRRDGTIQTAAPIPGVGGELVHTLQSPSGRPDRHAVAFERLPGKEPQPDADSALWFERLGEQTAKMHLHAKSWRLPNGFRRKRWDLEGMVGPQCYWGSWRAGVGLDHAGTRILERALEAIRERLRRFGMGADRFGLIHADLRLANLLADEPHLRIIDFDDCGFSWFVYDFAAAVSFIERDPLMPTLLDAWVTGYRRAAPLGEADRNEIPTFILLRRILLTAWIASHGEVAAAREMGPTYTAGTIELAERFLQGSFLQGVS
jgi:Ser/Thr protein kinase RdoA (MazF antagonist)